MAGSLYLLALFYGIFILKEVPKKTATTPQPTVKKSFLADFFDLNHIKETFSVAFRNGPRRRRTKILALMAVIIIAVGPQHGEMSLFYLFTRYKFNWSEVEFSIFATYSVLVHLIGNYLSLLTSKYNSMVFNIFLFNVINRDDIFGERFLKYA